MDHPDTSTYMVHWMLTYQTGSAEDYGKAIRKGWWTSSGVRGLQRLACDWLADVVVVMIELPADDIAAAMNLSRDQVIGALERADLPLPKSMVMIAGAVSRG